MLSQTQMVRIRKAKEIMYIGLCTIVEYHKVKQTNQSTGFTEVAVFEDIPCKNRRTSCPDQLAKALKIYKKYVLNK